MRHGSRAAKSLPYVDLYYMATNAYGNGIYLLDAYPQTIFITTQKYNPQTDVWTSVKKIPTYRAVSSAEQAAVAVTVGAVPLRAHGQQRTVLVWGGRAGRAGRIRLFPQRMGHRRIPLQLARRLPHCSGGRRSCGGSRCGRHPGLA